MSIVIPQVILDRYREACAEPTINRWRSLAYLAGFMADNIEHHAPQNEMADDIRILSLLAWQHSIDMMPQPVEREHYNSLAGVIIGWFQRLRGVFA